MTLFLAALTLATLVWPTRALRRSLRSITAHRDAADIARIEEGLPEREPEPWPARQTPTDLAAAYDEPPSARHVSWIELPTAEFERYHRRLLDEQLLREQERWQQAREWLDQILVDVRDGALV